MNKLLTILFFFLLKYISSNCSGYYCPKLYILNKKTCLCDPENKLFLCKRPCFNNLVITPFCECKIPAFCKAIPCPEGTIKDPSNCVCYPLNSIKPLPFQKNCGIRKCKRYHELDKKNCKCVEKKGDICEIACPPRKKIYPGVCRCKRIIKCPIKRCKRGFRKSLKNVSVLNSEKN